MTYREAMRAVRSDKPDIRFGLELHGQEACPGQPVQSVRAVIAVAGVVAGLAVPGRRPYTRNQLDNLERFHQGAWSKGPCLRQVARERIDFTGCQVSPRGMVQRFAERSGRRPATCCCLWPAEGGDRRHGATPSQVRARTQADRSQGARPDLGGGLPVAGVRTKKEKRRSAMHHPFTSPVAEDMPCSRPIPVRSGPKPMTWW